LKTIKIKKMMKKYFKEIEELNVKGQNISNGIDFSIDTPNNYSIIYDTFTVEGWAIDTSDIEGAAIDYVGIYLDNKPQDGGKFISKCEYGIVRDDIENARGQKYKNSGFYCQIDSYKIGEGVKKLYVFVHSNYFGWKYDTVDIFVYHYNDYVLKDIIDQENECIEYNYATISKEDGSIIIEEGNNVLKYVKFPVILESGYDYLVTFEMAKTSNLNNSVNFDFYGNGYDNPEQEFNISYELIAENYKRVNRLINSGDVPQNADSYFRIFTDSSGSITIKDLHIYKITKIN